jgi:hypothetical protein
MDDSELAVIACPSQRVALRELATEQVHGLVRVIRMDERRHRLGAAAEDDQSYASLLTIFNSGGYWAWSPGARCAMP